MCVGKGEKREVAFLPGTHPSLALQGTILERQHKAIEHCEVYGFLFFFNSKNTYMFCSCILNILQTSEVCPRLLTSFGKSHLEGGEIFGDYFNIVKKWQK